MTKSKNENKEGLKKNRIKAIKKINDVFLESNSSGYFFSPWIPKDSKNKTPIRFYVKDSKCYIMKFQNQMIIHSPDTGERIKIESFLQEHNINLENISKLSELKVQLEDKDLIYKNNSDGKEQTTSVKLQSITYKRSETLDKTLVNIIAAVIDSNSELQAITEGIIAASSETKLFNK